MQRDELIWPRELRPSGLAFQKRVANPLMFRAYMLAKQTTLGVTGAYLDVIEVTRARMILPEAFTARDLFGRVATAAVVERLGGLLGLAADAEPTKPRGALKGRFCSKPRSKRCVEPEKIDADEL